NFAGQPCHCGSALPGATSSIAPGRALLQSLNPPPLCETTPAMKPLFLLVCLLGLDAGAETIKIVSSFPRTGSANAQSQTMVNGIKMALDEFGYKAGGFTI